MGMNELKQQFGTSSNSGGLQGKDVVQAFPDMIKALTRQVQLALPKHLSADRMCRIALTAFRQNPDLANCDPRSVFAAVVVAAQMGLEININGQGYIVPYNNRKTGRKEAQFIPGWRGLVDLAQRSGRSSVWTGAVFRGDKFSYALGSDPILKHEPGDENEVDKLERAYAIGRVKGADYPVIEVWTVAKIVKHRNKYNKVGNRHYSFDNFEMYARKVPLMQVLKYMPMSIELAAAISLEKQAEIGNQPFNLEEAIAGDFVVMAADRGDHEITEAGETIQPKAAAPMSLDNESELLAAVKACHTLEELDVLHRALPDNATVGVEAAVKDRLAALTQRHENELSEATGQQEKSGKARK